MNLITFLIIYFIPYLISCLRSHNNCGPIFVTNLVFGWTVIGWFVALIWSITDNTKEKGTA